MTRTARRHRIDEAMAKPATSTTIAASGITQRSQRFPPRSGARSVDSTVSTFSSSSGAAEANGVASPSKSASGDAYSRWICSSVR
jgi:hypothetical protein